MAPPGTTASGTLVGLQDVTLAFGGPPVLDGATRRLRPILMTALATIFALVPTATGITGNSGFISQPLALVVIGGLVSSTVLTLLVLPTLYYLVEGRQERREARLARRAERGATAAARRPAAQTA